MPYFFVYFVLFSANLRKIEILKRSSIFYLLIVCVFISSCKSTVTNPNAEIEVLSQFSELQAQMDKHSDKVLVLNFWATTCPPCIKEMPHFKELEQEYNSSELKVLLVNLDLFSDFEKRVLPFITKHQIVPEVQMLVDENYSAWTDKIDSSWYGALPATLISYKDERKFRFGLYETYDELKEDVSSVLFH